MLSRARIHGLLGAGGQREADERTRSGGEASIRSAATTASQSVGSEAAAASRTASRSSSRRGARRKGATRTLSSTSSLEGDDNIGLSEGLRRAKELALSSVTELREAPRRHREAAERTVSLAASEAAMAPDEILRRARDRARERKRFKLNGGVEDAAHARKGEEDEEEPATEFLIQESGAVKLVQVKREQKLRAGEGELWSHAMAEAAANEPAAAASKMSKWRNVRTAVRTESAPAAAPESARQPPSTLDQKLRRSPSPTAMMRPLAPKPPRQRFLGELCFYFARSRTFAVLVLLAIGVAAVTETLDTSTVSEAFLRNMEWSLNFVFTLEMLIKMNAFGLCQGPQAYFAGWENTFDAFILATGWLLLLLDDYIQGELKLLKLLRLARVLRPLTSINMLRDILNSMMAAARSLGANLLIIFFFLFLIGILSVALLSGTLRNRCYDAVADEYFEPKGLVCSNSSDGRMCSLKNTGRDNATCQDSGYGFYARLEGQTPWFANEQNATAPHYANPEYGTLNFDIIHWSLLQIFQV